MAIAIRANQKDAEAASPMARRCAPPGSGPRPRHARTGTLANPGNKPLLASYGRALVTTVTSSAGSTSLRAPIRLRILNGDSVVQGTRSISSAGMTNARLLTSA